MPKDFYLTKNHNRNEKHKFSVTYINDETNKENEIKFGHKDYSDMTLHGDVNRRRLYDLRHKSNENWGDLTTRGAWSKWILWNQPSIAQSIRNMENRFNINIHYKD
jgi:hypothetical protein